MSEFSGILCRTAIANKPRLGFVKYDEHETCLVAQHLSDTFLLDRALTVVPVAAGKLDF